MPGRAGRAHRPDHLPQQLITQLRLIPATGQARRLRRPDIPRGGLHVHARPPGRRALTRPGQPRPQDLYHLCHQNLPERHPLPSLPVRNEPEDHSRVVHQLANQVVPSPWQQPSAGGPMLMADDMQVRRRTQTRRRVWSQVRVGPWVELGMGRGHGGGHSCGHGAWAQLWAWGGGMTVGMGRGRGRHGGGHGGSTASGLGRQGQAQRPVRPKYDGGRRVRPVSLGRGCARARPGTAGTGPRSR